MSMKITAAILAAFGLLFPALGWESDTKPQCSLRIEKGGVATVRGLVIERDDSTDVDGILCFVLSCGEFNFGVVVHGGMLAPSTSKSIDEISPSVKPGDVIEAHGKYSKSRFGQGIDLRGKDSYWIKVVSKAPSGADKAKHLLD